MKGMMIVIDKMENTSDRDSESYSTHLDHLLDLESNAIEGAYPSYSYQHLILTTTILIYPVILY